MKFVYTVNAKPENANGEERNSTLTINTKDPERAIFLDNLSHGIFFEVSGFINTIANFCRYKNYAEEDGSYNPDDYGIPDEIEFASLEITDEDNNEKLLMTANNQSGYIFFSMNDGPVIKCQYDGYVISDLDPSIKIHVGISLNKNCPSISDYLGYHLVIFDIALRDIQCSDEMYSKFDDTYKLDCVDRMLHKQRTSVAVTMCAYMSWCDVFCFSSRDHGDADDRTTFEWLKDAILECIDGIPSVKSTSNKIFCFNQIIDKEFIGIQYVPEFFKYGDSPFVQSAIELLKSFVNNDDENSDAEIIPVPISFDEEDFDKGRKAIKDKISDYLISHGITGANVDGIANTIISSYLERKNKTDEGDPGVFIGGIDILYNPETHKFDSFEKIKNIDISKDDILNIASSEFKDDAINDLIQDLRERNRVSDDVTDDEIRNIINSIIDDHIDDDDENDDGGNE